MPESCALVRNEKTTNILEFGYSQLLRGLLDTLLHGLLSTSFIHDQLRKYENESIHCDSNGSIQL